MDTTMYMIRHAESPFVFGEERTRTLSEQGELDAKKVTVLMDDMNIDLIVSSPYRRAIQTVEGIAKMKSIEVSVREELRERQLKGAYRLREEDRQQAIELSYHDIDFSLAGGESVRDVQLRAIPVIKGLLYHYQGKTIIVGTHGNIMTIIMNYFNKEYGYEFWKNTTKPDIYELLFSNENLVSVNRIWK